MITMAFCAGTSEQHYGSHVWGGAVLREVFGELIAQSSKLTGKLIKTWIERALAKALMRWALDQMGNVCAAHRCS